MKALVLYGNEQDRRFLRYNLARLSFEVFEADDEEDAWEIASLQSPDLVICEVPMAGMKGFQFLRRLKQDKRLKNIPVITCLSGHPGAEYKRFALSIGAASFLMKPDDPREFWGELKKAIDSAREGERGSGDVAMTDNSYWKNISSIASARLEEMGQELERETSLRRQAEESQRKSDEHYQTLFETSPEAILILDLNATVMEANYTTFTLFRYESLREIRGRSIVDFVLTEERPKALREIGEFQEKGYVQDIEHKLRKKDGTVFPAWIRASLLKDDRRRPYAIILSVRDISEKKVAELHFMKSRKMKALETLAGGVSSEFNSLVEQIIAIASPLRAELKKSPLFSQVEGIITSAEKSAAIIKRLRLFSGKEKPDLAPVHLNEVISGAVNLLERFLSERIRVRFVSVTRDLMVMADSAQISQILMNIAVFSRDSMPEGGSLSITTTFLDMDNNFIRTHGYGKLWHYALITISDTGCGMDEHARERIFEPYFTADEAEGGKAEFLGLAAVYGIVKELKGYIDVSSEAGKGTTFRIYLPLLKTREDTSP
ncbi:MAG: PAS domain S-box protein [Nitrospirales bacterium]|nr:PAS domain S-box protein [Nitrospirales bacterium]